MKYTIPVLLLFIALGHPSLAQKAERERQREREAVVVVEEGAPLTVECEVGVEERADWSVDGAAPAPDLAARERPAAGGARLVASLHAAAARPLHAGLYSCSGRPVRVHVLPLAEADAGAGVGAGAGGATAAPSPQDGVLMYKVTYDLGRNLTLDCRPTGNVDLTGVVFSWTVNGSALEAPPTTPAVRQLAAEASRSGLLNVTRALEDDFGNYSCSVGGRARAAWAAAGRPRARILPEYPSVVEGQKLKVTCRVFGKPYPPVDWEFASNGVNYTSVEEAFPGRVQLAASEAGVPGGALTLEAARPADAGQLRCVPAAAGAEPGAAVLRVKDKYAALWPFLGICAEVVVLCAVILVYERRRAKPELDDSDTDNHDQKKS